MYTALVCFISSLIYSFEKRRKEVQEELVLPSHYDIHNRRTFTLSNLIWTKSVLLYMHINRSLSADFYREKSCNKH